MNTKAVCEIKPSSDYEGERRKEAEMTRRVAAAKEALRDFDELYALIEFSFDQTMMEFEDKDFVLYPELHLLMFTSKPRRISVKEEIDQNRLAELLGDFDDFEGKKKLLTAAEARKIFYEYSSKDRPDGMQCQNILCTQKGRVGYISRDQEFVGLSSDSTEGLPAYHLSYGSLHAVSMARLVACHHLPGNWTKMELFLEYGLVPKEMAKKDQSLLRELISLKEQGFVGLREGCIVITKKGVKAVRNGECVKIGHADLSRLGGGQSGASMSGINLKKCSREEKRNILSEYLKCDTYRANMREYDLKRMEDPNLGHWELWEENALPGVVPLSSGSQVYARNPIADIREDSIVGIDFGTRSTAVVYQNESGKIRPMPVGCGDSRKELEAEDFENPTVMQFINLRHFIKQYQMREGRPCTLWRDLLVSHAASESMKDTGIRSDEYYSFLSDLKQWAGEGEKKTTIRDKQGKDMELRAYRDIIGEGDDGGRSSIDPIEIYAYYIGLHVNNMETGIYMDYLLSFPVTYEKKIRTAILESFRRGLKKSLPESVQKDEEWMSRFRVEAGASEPAAYAICALEKYGLDPEPGDEVFYGIFDFGGGTADFDFGLWKASENEEIYDYSIEHFASGGDRYLGGENLLQLLAFEVFRENIETCRKENITFSKPVEKKDVPVELKGSVSDSQEARMNLKFMMEKLRPFWEREDGSQQPSDVFDSSAFQIGLFDADGEYRSNVKFQAEKEVLEGILRKRIMKGVRQFFNALKGVFENKYLGKTLGIDCVHIFLAGNASKSPILSEIFQENINEWSGKIEGKGKKKSSQTEFFKLYPPLGSEKAWKMLGESGDLAEYDLEEPTGKTGVAWGLIEGRKGGRIEVREEITADMEAKFAYYLGISVKKKFKVKIAPDTAYGQWHRFIPAVQERFEMVYTSLPEATTGKLSERDEGVMRKRLSLEEHGEGLSVFVRLTGITSLEYAVGDQDGLIHEDTIRKVAFEIK